MNEAEYGHCSLVARPPPRFYLAAVENNPGSEAMDTVEC